MKDRWTQVLREAPSAEADGIKVVYWGMKTKSPISKTTEPVFIGIDYHKKYEVS